MKRHEIIFSLVKIPGDFMIVFVSFFIARELRLITDFIPGVVLPIQTIDPEILAIYALWGALLYIIVLALHNLYVIQISSSKIGEILSIIRYSIYWFLFFSVGVYLLDGVVYTGNDIPRLIIVFTLLLSIIGSMIFRTILNILQSKLLEKNILSKRNIILISNKKYSNKHSLLRDISFSKIYNIIGYSNTHKIEDTSLEYIGSLKKLKKLFRERACDEILYIESDYSKKELYKIWEYAKIYGVRYRYITNSFDITKSNTVLSLIHKTPVIEIENTPLEYWGRVMKRIFDIICSVLALVLLSPLILLIALCIKLEDPAGPVIYMNRRIGQNGKIFNCLKFRYLFWKYSIKESYGIENSIDPAIAYEQELIKGNSKRKGPLYKIQSDPRKTKIGRILEKYSLDEIPQFINVLLGDMSVVGPRPHQPREVQKYELYQERLLTIKPGITGMAQVNGREQNNFEKEAKLDIFYIENWSFLLDLKIIAKTLTIILSRK